MCIWARRQLHDDGGWRRKEVEKLWMMEHHFISSADVALKLVFNFCLIHRKSSCASLSPRSPLWQANEKKIQQKKKHIKNNDDDAEYLAFLSPRNVCTMIAIFLSWCNFLLPRVLILTDRKQHATMCVSPASFFLLYINSQQATVCVCRVSGRRTSFFEKNNMKNVSKVSWH